MSEIQYIKMETIIRQAEHIGSLKALIQILISEFQGMDTELPEDILRLKYELYTKYDQ